MRVWEEITMIINHEAQRNNYNNIILHLQRTYDLTKICSRTILKRLRSVFLILCCTGIVKHMYFFESRTKSVVKYIFDTNNLSK